ncbi:gfo/Idh/MocA family oxidoreductase [Clostridiales bacterium COT073_COT-073]|nr:gfo/Idh/MocA family oxidoreductase [Clostridiales bacterium COT073_COT-073]
MNNKLGIGIVGLGRRGMALLESCILPREDVYVVAVCDLYEDRIIRTAEILKEAGKPEAKGVHDYREILQMEEVEAIIITSSWEEHVEIACASMYAGKYTAIEVGGAYSIDQCWQLVHTYEQTKTECMFLENCCFGREELLLLSMVRHNVFGELVHCQGGYLHDLREQIAYGKENRHYRLRNYIGRNCENYPTHELGPIANILDINRGNRMLTLVSVASKAAGMREYLQREKGVSYKEKDSYFAQGDIVTTVIQCARGETICLTLDTTLPRPYSRGLQVHGTKGMYMESNRSVFLDEKDNKFDLEWNKKWNNLEEYFAEYEHPVWRKYLDEGIRGGHDGMDWLTLAAFFKAAKERKPVPIDIYDAASWMSISCLSEESIAKGGMPVFIPDFTNGKWLVRTPWNVEG